MTPPDSPARPAGLRFSEVRAPFPHQLHRDEARGRALHYFANHELLAIELMALALLRFPGAPSKFRRGLVQTILEEQSHLRLYRARMQALGVGLGDVPVSSYFWSSMRNMASPLDYVTGMSLTFEQANLDFSLHYTQRCEEVGDQQTAALLRKVYEDEIGHVRLGVRWFEQLRPGEASAWEEYSRLLPAPLSPSRAKGPLFDVKARQRAGLSDAFIESLSVYSRSKGRAPVAFWFNPAFESELASGHDAYTPDAQARTTTRDLAPLLMFLAQKDDVVCLPRKPSIQHLQAIKEAGIALPELLESPPDEVPQPLVGRRLMRLQPWGWSPRARRVLAGLEPTTVEAPPQADMRALASKTLTAKLLAGEDAEPGASFEDASAAIDRARAWIESGYTKAILKAPLSTSGRDRLFVLPDRAVAINELGWIENTIRAQGCVVVEPWFDKICDLSAQLMIAPGRRPLVSIDRFWTDGRGRYRGHLLGNLFERLDPQDVRALGGGALLRKIRGVAQRVGAHLQDAGYRGPAGLDMLVYRGPHGAQLRPVVELNPRWTMGHIAARLKPKIAPGCSGVWTLVQARELAVSSFADLAASLPELQQDAQDRIIAGALPTTDPAHAEQTWSVLLVAQRPQDAWGLLSAGVKSPPP